MSKQDEIREAMEAHSVFERPLADALQGLLDRLDNGFTGTICGLPFTIKAKPLPDKPEAA